jgi:predicted secreted hydrolase
MPRQLIPVVIKGKKHVQENKFLKKIDDSLEKFSKKQIQIYRQFYKEKNLNKIFPHTEPKKKLVPNKNIQLEWWYFTGHLKEGKKEYGFELCFFKLNPFNSRFIFFPLSQVLKKEIMVAHFAITDIHNKRLLFFEKNSLFNEHHINHQKLDISLDNWYIKGNKKLLTLQAKTKEVELKLDLIPLKKLVAQGRNGYSLKSKKPHHASFYYSFPRLKAKGTLKLKNQKFLVNGNTWFDHEKSYSPHNSIIKGWDWFSIMLNNNTEIMFHQMRSKTKVLKKYSNGIFIDKNERKKYLSYSDINIKSLWTWQSPKSKIIYPSGWEIQIKSLKAFIKIIPKIREQEINSIKSTIITYWEGACHVSGSVNGKTISGDAYVELVGYDKRILPRIILYFMK